MTPNPYTLLARAERAVILREQALNRYKAACAAPGWLTDDAAPVRIAIRSLRVDRCARLVRETFAEVVALIHAWHDLAVSLKQAQQGPAIAPGSTFPPELDRRATPRLAPAYGQPDRRLPEGTLWP